MAVVLAATVVAPNGAPCRVLNSDAARHQIAGEKSEKEKVAHQQHGLSGERVHQVAAERTHQKGHNSVAGQHQSYGVFCGAESFVQI